MLSYNYKITKGAGIMNKLINYSINTRSESIKKENIIKSIIDFIWAAFFFVMMGIFIVIGIIILCIPVAVMRIFKPKDSSPTIEITKTESKA